MERINTVFHCGGRVPRNQGNNGNVHPGPLVFRVQTGIWWKVQRFHRNNSCRVLKMQCIFTGILARKCMVDNTWGRKSIGWCGDDLSKPSVR